jgi:hypothetical protein
MALFSDAKRCVRIILSPQRCVIKSGRAFCAFFGLLFAGGWTLARERAWINAVKIFISLFCSKQRADPILWGSLRKLDLANNVSCAFKALLLYMRGVRVKPKKIIYRVFWSCATQIKRMKYFISQLLFNNNNKIRMNVSKWQLVISADIVSTFAFIK